MHACMHTYIFKKFINSPRNTTKVSRHRLILCKQLLFQAQSESSSSRKVRGLIHGLNSSLNVITFLDRILNSKLPRCIRGGV